jgi:sulfate adenylyltransferase
VPSPPVPQHCPTPVELDDLELLASGALGDLRAFNQPGSPVTLTLPEVVSAEARSVGAVEIVDPEGLPLARVSWPEGVVDPLAHPEYGPFRELMLTPAAYRERYAGRTVVPVSDPLDATQLDELSALGPLTLLTFTGAGTPWLSPVGLVRATRAAAELLPDAVVVTVPLAAHGDVQADHKLGIRVAETFAAGDPTHALSSPVAEVRGAPAPSLEASAADETYPPEIQRIVDHDRPPADRQGLVVFFTGLSGSGKSTLARALVDLLLEQGERTVTSLDGDVVRRNLSAGLSFSKEDRETNIRRIGWVAAEIARHGGVAVVSPIAPFDETRQQVREMVEDAGGAMFLVHVATPLEECERRDRKGLYAKARAGKIPEFTGISSPYEEPEDADVRVDTTGRTIEDALHDVLAGLRDSGYVDLLDEEAETTTPGSASVAEVRGAPATSLEAPAAADANPTQAVRRPLKVLFVCTANICRSPSVELLARQAMPDTTDIVFSSAGTHGSDGGPVDAELASALPADLLTGEFRSRRLTAALLEDADLVLTMEAAQRSYILADHPEMFRKVFTLGQFAQAVGRAPEGLARDAVLAHVAETRGNADPALDVPDPYRRGPEAASGCVARLQELLRAVLPALSR